MEGDASTPRPGLICPFEKMRPSQLNRDDAFYMALAFNLAVDAWRIDEVPIGAIIERGGEIIAAGSPEDVAKVKESYTGQFLKPILEKAKGGKGKKVA